MSDPIAVSILAKLTSWYALDSDLTDSHGVNHLATGVTNAGFATGKVGNMLNASSKAGVTLASAIPITNTTGALTIGGWMHYTGSVPAHADFGLCRDYGAQNEVFSMDSETGAIGAFGWNSGGLTTYSVWSGTGSGLGYPVTVRVMDSAGQVATSDQVISIYNPAAPLATGWYFAVATWNAGNMVAYVDGKQTATSSPPAAINASSITRFQIGNQFNGNLSVAGLDSIFFCGNAVMTADEVSWLFNRGAGRSYASIVAAAA